MADENVFNVEEFLTNPVFTIPVELTEPKIHPGTTPKKRIVLLTYQFTDESANKIKDGVLMDNPDYKEGAAEELPEKIRRSMTLNEQLVMMVTKIDGVETEPTEAFWERVVFKYKQKFIDAILKDIYPNAKTSTGS